MEIVTPGPTCQSARGRVRMTKAQESYMNKPTTKKTGNDVQREIETRDEEENEESETRSAIEVHATTPTAPQPTRTATSAHLKEHAVAVKVRAFSAKSGERSTPAAKKSNQLAPKEASVNASAQIETLTSMVTCLLREIEEQKQEHVK
ncbi:hypothetical protein K469DRAFT_744982 [Zopfia rhizophila CBS 207.26]|uniref:Uncharacterized protein n=1 Tax=Zopfia rhizophila CBS 207.26 TaxID=1314779 RepID=A0A6A6EQT4_9PEZI|nr:hypothetical protein K469DRAFT_744982 [Zopfia rhizophila CBS 207.26]